MPSTTTPRQRRGTQPREIVRKLRLAAGLSQYELAKRAGLSRSLMCEIESGRRSLTAASGARLATVLEVTPDTFQAAA